MVEYIFVVKTLGSKVRLDLEAGSAAYQHIDLGPFILMLYPDLSSGVGGRRQKWATPCHHFPMKNETHVESFYIHIVLMAVRMVVVMMVRWAIVTAVFMSLIHSLHRHTFFSVNVLDNSNREINKVEFSPRENKI